MKKDEESGRLTIIEEEKIIVGNFMKIAIDIEMIMDEIINYHFCKTEDIGVAFREFILPEIPFKRKAGVLRNIVPKILADRYSTALDLNKLIEWRNKFAHRRMTFFLDKNDKIDRSKISFHRIVKNNTQHDTTSINDLNAILEDFTNQCAQLNDLCNEFCVL
jgi:hypothetical protein